jgi:hypothetical protein
LYLVISPPSVLGLIMGKTRAKSPSNCGTAKHQSRKLELTVDAKGDRGGVSGGYT